MGPRGREFDSRTQHLFFNTYLMFLLNMESTGNLHRVHGESSRSPHGVHGESSWSPHGVHEILLEESPWSPCGLVDSMESPCGLLEMLNVVLLKSMESPQSPHGVCGNVWGSVKYSQLVFQSQSVPYRVAA